MSNMTEKTFKNEELAIELKSYIDKQQNIWFRGKDVSQILGYKDTNIIKQLENMLIIKTKKATPSKRRVRSDGVIS